jgi:hypothetical protein
LVIPGNRISSYTPSTSHRSNFFASINDQTNRRLARERPDQILAVFIRDVELGEVIEDPTGWKAVGASSLNGERWPRQSWSVSSSASASTPSSRPTTPAYSLPPSREDYFPVSPAEAPVMTAEPDAIVDMNAATPMGGQFRGAQAASVRSVASSASAQRMPEGERKRYELQLRVWRARTQMPGHVPLRIFRDPAECVEAEEALKKEKV